MIQSMPNKIIINQPDGGIPGNKPDGGVELGNNVCDGVREGVTEGVKLGNWIVIEASGINVVVAV